MREQLSQRDTSTLSQARDLHLQGQFPEATVVYEKLLRKYPRNMIVKSLLGSVLIDQGEVIKALPLLKHAASKERDNADIHYNLGLAHAEAGQDEDAIAPYRRAVQLNPEHSKAHYNLGLAYRRLERHADAVTCFRRDFELSPQADTCRLLTRSLKALEEFDEALFFANECVALEGAEPSDLDELIFLLCLKYTRQAHISTQEQTDLFALADHAVQLDPTNVAALMNCGRAYSLLGEYDTALAPLAQAVQLDPENDALSALYGISLLTTGQIQQGWHYRTVISRMQKPVTETGVPRWNGELRHGLKLWLTAEQGIGDQVLYARMLKDLQDSGLELTLVCEERLHALFARSFPDIKLCTKLAESEQPQQDAFATLGELHQYLRPTIKDIPAPGTWLKPDAQRAADIRAQYECLYPGKRVCGLAWRSHSDANGAGKSVPLDDLLPLLKDESRVFVCVQYGHGADELETHAQQHGYTVHVNPINSLHDIDAGAAQLAALDELISVSNASVHIAAAMGVVCHVLVGQRPVWHWFTSGSQSPWYENVYLYRQTNLQDWQAPIAQLKDTLQT